MADIDHGSLLGCNPLSIELGNFLAFLAAKASANQPISPQLKSYPDSVYFNYHNLGLSLQFAPKDGYKPTSGLKQCELQKEKLSLDSIYIYNEYPPFSAYPVSPLVLKLNPNAKDKEGSLLSRPSTLEIQRNTTGKEFVQVLLEPDRKGGGTGPSSGSIGIWCEWTKDGIMVEFGGPDAKGSHAWDKGKDAPWKIITTFASSS